MCRLSFGSIIAFVTFTLGLGAFCLLNYVQQNQIVQIENKSSVGVTFTYRTESSGIGYGSATAPFPMNHVKPELPEPKDRPRFCKDKTISLIWKQLQRDEKDFWERVSYQPEVYNCAEMFEAQWIDFNGDGAKEIKIRGKYSNFCGATGNCSEWIYAKNKKSGKYRMILSTGGEYFHIWKAKTNGYQDIYVKTHDSASSSYNMIYKFDGKVYKERKCWFEDFWMINESESEQIIQSCAEKSKEYENQN